MCPNFFEMFICANLWMVARNHLFFGFFVSPFHKCAQPDSIRSLNGTQVNPTNL